MSLVLYGLSGDKCKFCKDAARRLDHRNVTFKFVDVSQSEEFFQFFKTVHTTVPQIYEDGVHLGDSSAATFAGTPEEVIDNDEFTL